MNLSLELIDLHWLRDTEEKYDRCAHGRVFLQIGDRIVSDEGSDEWTVSSTAYYFLKYLRRDYLKSEGSPLLPCCGFTFSRMIDDPTQPIIFGCPNGIDWQITHKPHHVEHIFDDGYVVDVDFHEWRRQVCKFSDQVKGIYDRSAPKISSDAEEKEGFDHFMMMWKTYREEANGY